VGVGEHRLWAAPGCIAKTPLLWLSFLRMSGRFLPLSEKRKELIQTTLAVNLGANTNQISTMRKKL